MRVVALISGGKDSCFNMMHCVKNGHEVVALAHLKPEGQDELDSYMFQTVGHNLIELYAEALGLPLFQRTITGSSVCTDSIYVENDKDEVEDLFKLLITVKQSIVYDAVSSGAILSNYQRIRVENVCSRIGVQSLAYLWQRKQEELLNEMIEANLHAILIKVASLGLKPRAHLGKSLHELAPLLHEMHNKYELNVCGEGGEYETMTLDCPLFLKKIVIDEQEIVIHSDDAFAPVGYLSLKKMHLEDKGMCPNSTLLQRITNCDVQIPKLMKDGMLEYFPKSNLVGNHSNSIDISIEKTALPDHCSISYPQFVVFKKRVWVTEIVASLQDGVSIEDVTMVTMNNLKELVENNNYNMADISLVHIFCSSMANFARINSAYKKFFISNPPARVCVEIPLATNTIFKMDVCLDKSCSRNALHVQSMSYWAPANIGPYSQVVSVGQQFYFSGSIGMDPSSLTVVKGFEQEALLSLHHVKEVSKVFIPNQKSMKDHGLVNCYVIDQSKIDYIKQLFICQDMFDSSRYILNVVSVPALPKNASVEWHVLSKWVEPSLGDTCIHGDDTFRFNIDFFKMVIHSTDFQADKNLYDIFKHFLTQYSFVFTKTEFIRVYYLSHIFERDGIDDLKSNFNSSMKTVVEKLPAMAFVPVIGLENDVVIAISGVTSD